MAAQYGEHCPFALRVACLSLTTQQELTHRAWLNSREHWGQRILDSVF